MEWIFVYNAERLIQTHFCFFVIFYLPRNCCNPVCLTCLLCWCARWRDAVLKCLYYVTQAEGLSEGYDSVMIGLISRHSHWSDPFVSLWNAHSANCLLSLIKLVHCWHQQEEGNVNVYNQKRLLSIILTVLQKKGQIQQSIWAVIWLHMAKHSKLW